jgi:hypothetical protein
MTKYRQKEYEALILDERPIITDVKVSTFLEVDFLSFLWDNITRGASSERFLDQLQYYAKFADFLIAVF